jgi:CRISPR/Cas system-associated exonuclease Cas4 (RecB family)
VTGLEILDFSPSYSLLRYRLRSDSREERELKIQVDDELMSRVVSTAESIKRILEGKEKPIPPRSKNKCRGCPEHYREACDYKLC